jgi:hypothetical protein
VNAGAAVTPLTADVITTLVLAVVLAELGAMRPASATALAPATTVTRRVVSLRKAVVREDIAEHPVCGASWPEVRLP